LRRFSGGKPVTGTAARLSRYAAMLSRPAIPNLNFLNHTVGVRLQFLGGSFLKPPYPAVPSLPFPSQGSNSTG
jgi:hypothetical protein